VTTIFIACIHIILFMILCSCCGVYTAHKDETKLDIYTVILVNSGWSRNEMNSVIKFKTEVKVEFQLFRTEIWPKIAEIFGRFYQHFSLKVAVNNEFQSHSTEFHQFSTESQPFSML
jgi:hypothetical protein